MTGVNVLSDSVRGGSKLKNLLSSEGGGVSDGAENAAAAFAALLNGLVSPNLDLKGQDCKEGQNSESAQSGSNPVQGISGFNGQAAGPGYENFAFLVQTLPVLQSELPAGKDANSGANVGLSQGMEMNFLSLGSDELLVSTDESLASTGMTAASSQGNNLENSELVKYRQVINQLLESLSGKIINSSGEDFFEAGGPETQALRQELTKVIQGWLAETDESIEGPVQEAAKNMQRLPAETDQSVKGSVQEPAKNLQGLMRETVELKGPFQEAAKSIQGQVTEPAELIKNPVQEAAKSVQAWMTVMNKLENITSASGNLSPTLSAESRNFNRESGKVSQESVPENGGLKSDPDTNGKSRAQRLMDSLAVSRLKDSENSIGLSEVLSGPLKETKFLNNVEPKLERTSLLNRKPAEDLQLANEETKTDLPKLGNSGVKDIPSQPAIAGVGGSASPAEGRNIINPVWAQIASVIREQVMSKQQTLKELDIQLHPEELGKIRVLLRWESGLVHLHVQASEAATGQLLQNQHSELRQNLISNGVSCGSLLMGQEGDQQHPQDHDRGAFRRRWELSAEEEESSVLGNSIPGRQDGMNRINVTA